MGFFPWICENNVKKCIKKIYQVLLYFILMERRRLEIDIVNNAIEEYNRNQLHYNRNTERFISILNILVERPITPLPATRTIPRRRTTNSLTSPLFTNIPISSAAATSTGLTNAEIQEHTQTVQYTVDMQEVVCPISYENFEEGEQILKINHCGHIFKIDPIMRWFRQNKRCPVCRHQLVASPTTLAPLSTLENTILQNLSRLFNEDIHGFTFEIPLYPTSATSAASTDASYSVGGT
jgi:hypothetical protein